MSKIWKKISFIIALIIFITAIPLDDFVYAQTEPEITRITLIGVTDKDGNQTLMYQIYGRNLENPEFWVNGRLIDYRGYTIGDDGSYLIINNSTNNDIFESNKTHTFVARNKDGSISKEVDFTVKVVPWVTSVSKSKEYIGEELIIYGTGFDNEISEIVIGGNPYKTGEFEINAQSQRIRVPSLKPSQFPGAGDIRVIKETPEGHEIQGVYRQAITIVGKLEGIEISKIEPNAGSVAGGTKVRLIGVEGKSEFREDMRIYIDSVSPQNRFTDVQLFYDGGVLRGISGVTPPSPTGKQGVFDIIITDFTNSNELVLPNAFTYEDKENLLRLSNIIPPYGSEASVDETVDITGRNIVTLNIPNLVAWEVNKRIQNGQQVDKNPYYDYQNNAYVVNYIGKYRIDENEPEFNVNITREINLIIGKITEITSFSMSPSLDRVTAKIPSVDEPGTVNVTMKTTTTVTGINGEYILSRSEEYTLVNGFTFLPATTIPIIESIEPSRGPIDEMIYITIKGKNFQVLYKPNPDEDPSNPDDDFITIYPVIQVGNKIIDPNKFDSDDHLIGENIDWVEVYDDMGNLVNGIGRILGTVIKTAIPAHGLQTAFGLVDVIITNPDSGQSPYTDDPSKKFEFLKHNRSQDELPKIRRISPNMGPIEGGTLITIEGENFAYQNPVPNVIVTIDGQECKIVSASNTKITAIVPPGISIGEKPVQLITEDGAIDTIDPKNPNETRDAYTYLRQISNPQVVEISPNYGGEGTVVYIFGRDRGEEEPNFFAPNPNGKRLEEKIGTRVYLNDIDINQDKYYMVNGEITDRGDGIVFENGLQDSRVQVIDRNTLRIVIPGGFSPGLKDVKILNPDTSFTIVRGGFNYKIPQEGTEVIIDSIEPTLGSSSGGDLVTIRGSGFKEGAEVYFGGKRALNVSVNSTRDTITLTTPAYTIPNPDVEHSLTVDVTVINYDGSSATVEKGYTYMVPRSEPFITSISPSEGSTIGGQYVTIKGRDFRTAIIDGIPRPPKVLFGKVEAKEVIFMNDMELYVVTPYYGTEGTVDVTVINPGNEFGVHVRRNGFTFRASRPVINKVFPDKGPKNGGQEIAITGRNILRGNFPEAPKVHALAIFGDDRVQDRVIPDISGQIIRGKNILGDITIDYNSKRDPVETHDGEITTDSILIYHEKIEKPIAHYDLKPSERHLFIIDWRNILDKEIAPEGVMVELKDGMLTSTRRIAPRAEVVNNPDGTVTLLVDIPPSDAIGVKNLYVENIDGGRTSWKFEYVSPGSRPLIDTITPRSAILNPQGELVKYLVEASVEGGIYITIEGYDFRQGVEVFIDGVPADVISRIPLQEVDDEGRIKTRLIVRVPKGSSTDINKEKRIVVLNPDNGFADSTIAAYLVHGVPYYFVYRIPESKPFIESVLPTETSQAGGNRVRILGYDFREGAIVLIDGQECTIDYFNHDEIIIITPSDLSWGPKDVQVINKDYGTATKERALTIISYPIITRATTDDGSRIERVSTEGGDVIVIYGKNFQQGARVVFGGNRRLVSKNTSGSFKGLFADDQYYLVEGGYEAQKVEYVDENQLIVTLPEVLREDDYSITILNPDGGLSDDDYTLRYSDPVPSDPIGLRAEIVNDKYIRIYGYSSMNADYYEIYGYVGKSYPDDDEFMYLDITEKTSYRITKFPDIGKNENVYLKVRAVNKYGPSDWSNTVRISYSDLKGVEIGEDDTDGNLTSNYRETITGNTLNILLGEKLSGSSYSLYTIDLRDSKYANINKRTINIPRKVIRESTRTILVDNGDSRLQFSPSIFTYVIGSSSSSYGKVTIEKLQGMFNEQLIQKIPRGYKAVSKIYSIQTAVEENKNTTFITKINGYLDIEIAYDEGLLANMDENKLQIYKYDAAADKWVALPGGIDKDRNRIRARTNGPGEFIILGER